MLVCSTRCGPFSASGCGGLPPLPLVGPHSCHSGLCRPLVFCPLLSFPGRFVSIPGFCHLSIPLFFWPGEASMVLMPRPVTLSFLGHPALTSAARWLICPQKAAICTFFSRIWFRRTASLSFPRCTVRLIGHPRSMLEDCARRLIHRTASCFLWVVSSPLLFLWVSC